MPKDKKDKIKIYPETPHLILCEGADAYYFLIRLLDFFKESDPGTKSENDSGFKSFRAYDFGGTSELKQYLDSLAKTDDFKKIVRSLCVIRDAEASAEGAGQSIQRVFQDLGFAVPQKPCSWTTEGSEKYPSIPTGFILFPSCGATPENGTLEDLCLRILAKEGAKKVLSDADDALKPYTEQLPRLPKNRLHTYFSLTDEFVSLKVGEAAQAQAFCYDVSEIESLKSFLWQMAKGVWNNRNQCGR